MVWTESEREGAVHIIGTRGGLSRILVGLAFLSPLALGGCAILPAAGPWSGDIVAGQRDPKSLPYALVRVTPKITDILSTALPRLTAFSDHSRPRDLRFGIGDILSVTIFEAASGGLFIPSEAGVRPGNYITIPSQAIDIHGNISIPYAGEIRANGRTAVQVQQAIVDALKNRAIEPQVVVSLTDQRTSLITVLGAGRATRVPAQATPERILDVIGRAGSGLTSAVTTVGADLWIMLERGGRREIAPFGALVYEPANNIYAHPNDTIYLYSEPQTFLTFGALGTQQQIAFPTWRLSLAEAISRAGGLVDQLANPAAVFLYRGETREIAQAMGVDCTPFEGPIIPMIYIINLHDPAGYFLANTFEMRNKDVIYVSNSFSVESTKFMNYVNTVIATAQDPITFATSIYSLKNLIRGTGQVPSVINAGTTVVTAPPR
jgi:polysaccharide export outer membrane protein